MDHWAGIACLFVKGGFLLRSDVAGSEETGKQHRVASLMGVISGNPPKLSPYTVANVYHSLHLVSDFSRIVMLVKKMPYHNQYTTLESAVRFRSQDFR
jgi:hypothetical protein